MSRKTEKRELNTWYDALLWCPSQCYYYFMHGCDMFCIYLRWRRQNPWTVEISYNSTPNNLPPTKCICAWCHKKWQADYSGDIIHGEIWHEVDSFQNETRSDEELIASWFK